MNVLGPLLLTLCNLFLLFKPSGQNRQKNGMKECVFVNLALHSYRLLFQRFCPLGKVNYWSSSHFYYFLFSFKLSIWVQQ